MAGLKKLSKHTDQGDLERLRATLWFAVNRADRMVRSDEDTRANKGIYALGQASAQYIKTYELTEMVEQIKALEERLGTK